MPPRLRSSLARSRRTFSPSFFDISSTSPESTWRCNSRSLATRECTVWKLVSIPPSQRKLTYGMPHPLAAFSIGSCDCFLVPTKSTGAAAGDGLAHEPVRGVDAVEGLVEIDDVDPVALTEDETTHLRVPAPGLVAEMNSGLQELLHAYDGHGRASLGWVYRPCERRSVEHRRHHLGITGGEMNEDRRRIGPEAVSV